MQQEVQKLSISVEDLHKHFTRVKVGGGYTTLKTQLVSMLLGSNKHERIKKEELRVLNGLSFNVHSGEVIGIIGANGAGKSTLLKLLTGVYKPSSGTVRCHGRISALLELGAGFHPEFSGRENIYMNGMILGMSKKDLQKREEEIIEFSELKDFIDAPVRTYSSGMYMRLAFAVAVNVDPEILIIDEILGVGDAHFQKKSRDKLEEFKRKKATIILVTHSLETVRSWCTRAIWLEQGAVALDGRPEMVVDRYLAHVFPSLAAPAPVVAAPAAAPPPEQARKAFVDATQLRPFYHDFSYFSVHHEDAHIPASRRLNQQNRQIWIWKHLLEAIGRARAGRTDAPTVTELGPDGYYALYALISGAARAHVVYNDTEGYFAAVRTVAEQLGIGPVDFINRADAEANPERSDIVVLHQSLIGRADPLEEIRTALKLCKRFLVVHTIVSPQNPSPDYFEAPAPGTTYGCRFSAAWLRAQCQELRLKELSWSEHEQPGNQSPYDRGGVAALFEVT